MKDKNALFFGNGEIEMRICDVHRTVNRFLIKTYPNFQKD